MKTRLPTLLLALALVLSPAWLLADEEPAVPPPTPAKDQGADSEADAVAPPNPTEAYEAMQKALRGLSYMQRRSTQAAAVKAFLESWEAGGGTATGQDAYHLGAFYQLASRYAEAHSAFSAVMGDAGVEDPWKDQAAVGTARLLTTRAYHASLAPASRMVETGKLLAWLNAIPSDAEERAGQRTNLMSFCARLLDMEDRKDESMAMYMRLVMADPSNVTRSYRAIVRGLLGGTHSMEGYDSARRAFSAVQAVLLHQQGEVVAQAEAEVVAIEASGVNPFVRTDDQPRPTAEQNKLAGAKRTVSRARSMLKRIDSAKRPFEMLGRLAPAWTTEKAFGDVSQLTDLRGKVVVIDFWATWCGWCIKSFPAVRDLLRDYADQGLVVVGVTASAGTVYEHNYRLDDDLLAKAEGTYRPKAGARLASARNPADGKLFFDAADYRQREQEVLTRFIANHEMTWPVVMIDKAEPSAKFALTGWPHAVVLDRKGRVRYFKSGALLRDRPEAVAAFRKVLEDLLREP